MLIDSLRSTADILDATISGKEYGRLIVLIDEQRVYIETHESKIIDVLEGDTIEVITYDEGTRILTPITRQQALETLTAEGWPLYAGFYAFIK